MGTSGAYGGSNSAEWNDFRDAWSDLGTSPGGGTDGGAGDSRPANPSETLFDPAQPATDVDRVGQALIDALWRDDPATRGNTVPPIPRPVFRAAEVPAQAVRAAPDFHGAFGRHRPLRQQIHPSGHRRRLSRRGHDRRRLRTTEQGRSEARRRRPLTRRVRLPNAACTRR